MVERERDEECGRLHSGELEENLICKDVKDNASVIDGVMPMFGHIDRQSR